MFGRHVHEWKVLATTHAEPLGLTRISKCNDVDGLRALAQGSTEYLLACTGCSALETRTLVGAPTPQV